MDESSLSQLNIPITLKVKEIEETINKQIDGVFYENNDLADGNTDNIKIKAEKTENISISFDGNHINYRVPLKLLIKKEISFTSVEADGEIALRLSTEFKIEKDWKLTTHTKIIEYEWLQKPHLRFGIIDLPVKFIANTILEKSKTLLCTTLDEELAKNFDLQNYINQVWKTLQSPILMSEEFDLWVNIFPVKVGMTPLLSDRDIIKSTIMFHTYANAFIGEKPRIKKELPLPPFQLLDKIDEEFHLNLNTEITFTEAEKIVRKYVVGETFSSGKRSFRVEDIKLHGKEDKVVVETKLTGSYNGGIYFIGKPVFNPEKNEIEIKNLEYQLNTHNFLIRTFNWIFRRGIEKRLKKYMRFQITENLNELMNMVQKELENYEIADNILLNGNLSKLDLENIQMDEKGLNITINATGKLNLFINKIEIEKEAEN